MCCQDFERQIQIFHVCIDAGDGRGIPDRTRPSSSCSYAHSASLDKINYICVCGGGVTSLAQGATRSSTIAKPPHMSLTKLGPDFVFVKLPHSGGRSPTTVMLFLTPNGAAKGSETGNPTPSSPLAPRVAVATHSAGFPPAWRVNGNGAARRAVLLLGLAQSGHHREGDPRFKQVFLLHRRGHLATEPTNAPSYFTREINA